MKRTSWRAIPVPTDREPTLNGARPHHRPHDEASARPITVLPSQPGSRLKADAAAGDSPGVPPSRTPHRRTRTSAARHAPLNRRGHSGRPRNANRLRALLLVPTLAAAAVLAGCFSIIGQATVQEGDIGDVIVTTDMCLNGGTAGCEGGITETTDGGIQYFIGYLIPTWAVEPASISFNGGVGNLTLPRNVAYETTLQAFAPAPVGVRWVGYASDERPAPPTETDVRMQAIARIGIPDTAPSSLALGTVTGWRVVRPASDPKVALKIDRALNCSEETDGAPTTKCVLSGRPTQPTTPGGTPTTDDIPINTLTLGAPAPINAVRAGGTAVLKFPIATNYRGEGNDTIPMRVTTTLKGAKIESPPNVILGQAISPAEVRVTVPLIAETGDYTVTLATANGLRTATGTIRVVGIRSLIAPTTSSTAANLKEAAVQLRTFLKTAKSSEIRRGNIFDLPITLPAAGTITATLTARGRGGKALTSGDAKGRIPGAANLALKPTATGKKLLASGKPLKGRLALTYKPRSGKTQRAAINVTLR